MLRIEVKKTIKLRMAKLDHGDLTAIGRTMVDNQRKRWARGYSADNQLAPLKPKYAKWKEKINKKMGMERPAIRDMKLFGDFTKLFRLRRAEERIIRAEPTTRKAREHGRRANRIVQMIGFSGPEFDAILYQARKRYGDKFRGAVMRVGGGR